MSGVEVTINTAALQSTLDRIVPPWLEQLTATVADECKTAAPVGSSPDRPGGTLRDSITPRIEGTGAKARGIVTANAAHALAVHQGSRPHPIVARNARVLRFPSRDGRIMFRRRVNHPGNQRNPFMLNALVRVIGSR